MAKSYTHIAARFQSHPMAHGYRMGQKSVKPSLSLGGGDEVTVLDQCMECGCLPKCADHTYP
eukprot:scaffold169399_cov29-Prasinocladus_malaysianus.AAC.1